MADVITMPRLSDTMEEGKVAKWHKKVGDAVKEGEILAEIETDKAVQDFESEIDGVMLHIGVEEGNAAPVDSILCIIGEEGEDISNLLGGNTTAKVENSEVNSDKNDDSVEIENTANNNSGEIPAGVEIINMPRLSDTMSEGKVANWNKNVGDQVKEGDIIAEIETDKAVQDFESEFDGVLLFQGVEEGGAAPVDTILAIIGPAGTDISSLTSGKAKNSEKKTEKTADSRVETEGDEIDEADHSKKVEAKNDSGRIAISPLAKKMAEEKGLQISEMQGSGENGRIVKKDVENYQPSAKTEAATVPQKAAEASAKPVAVQMPTNFVAGETTETPNSQVRNIIAKRLSESKFTAPHYYLIVEINMDKAIIARSEINALPDTKISYNDMIIKAVAMALRKHPQVNSTWKADKIIHHGEINVGVAVAIPDGLVVPVLKNTDFMNYTQISAAVKDMAGRAKSKGLKANEMEGSTFSVSNLGMFGIETFTSIINQPNSAILSVGAIIEKPVVKDGQIVVGNTMKLSLACDHRVVDGATGAQFLQTLRTYLESPLSLLL
ncbi:2-oxo acid dehydrogenase subunit E2 [Frigoriflavimonas asaccharolytica]|uniref:Dihydrolipoamide acetyltransferase component of pyruvate dehydrogenase complex n=1 Tax=Frigoriflavimonas asaccharolytica TaxID=2735899 RepID=A0A8J8G9K9_9FLAO|nr:2-oxo acid dehydrogenase subunit E2 [Frigoriflavimonas asaccharolytica]NRS91492.1 pyruvate dehydrogenase E2 component (dihydrolipoamide acetyltransferase) [Frigoriflavimonas asaccharolytica]